MRLRRFFSIALAILWLVAMIYAISQGLMTFDLSGIPAFAWLYGAGALVLGIVWHRFMKSAALRESQGSAPGLTRKPLGEDFVAHWTRVGAAGGAAYLSLGVLVITVTAEYPPEGSEQIGAVIIATVMVAAVGGLVGAYYAQRYSRYVVAEFAEAEPRKSDNPGGGGGAV